MRSFHSMLEDEYLRDQIEIVWQGMVYKRDWPEFLEAKSLLEVEALATKKFRDYDWLSGQFIDPNTELKDLPKDKQKEYLDPLRALFVSTAKLEWDYMFGRPWELEDADQV